MSSTPDLHTSVGHRIRALRLAAERSQDEVAASARRLGYTWIGPTVAAIELGRRRLDLSEFWALPWILSAATGRPVSIADVMPGGAVMMTERFEIAQLDDLLKGPVSTEQSLKLIDSVSGTVGGRVGRELHVTGSSRPLRYGDLETAAGGDAERAAAGRLGVEPLVIAVVAFELWGRSLSDERDRRVDTSEARSRRSLQARRGHVTRGLIEELKEALEADDDGAR